MSWNSYFREKEKKMKYCKIWGMAIFVVGAAVGALGAPPKGDHQLYGKILGGNTDWRAEAAVAFEASEPGITDKLRIKGPVTPEIRGRIYSARYEFATQMNVGNGLVDSMHGVKVHLKENPWFLKKCGITRAPYEYECTLDRKSTYNFPDVFFGEYILSFSVAQPGIMSDEKRINHYSFKIHVNKTEFNIFCWDIFVPVKGRVLDATGKPVAGAKVRAFMEMPLSLSKYPYHYRSQDAWENLTDENGCYTLTLPSYYPFDYALFVKNHSNMPFRYIIAALAPGYEISSTPQFFPVNDELRCVGDVMANDLPEGPMKLDKEFFKQFILPEENLVLQCPDIHLQKADPNDQSDVKIWRLHNAYSEFNEISL